MSRYALNGGEYGRYSRAYEFGHSYAHRHPGRWEEAEARKAWESLAEGTWEDVRDAVYFGWEHSRNTR